MNPFAGETSAWNKLNPYMTTTLGIKPGPPLGLSISCSATFEQLFRFGATFTPSSNFSDFVQLFSFLNNFLAFLKLKTVHSSSNLKHQLLLCMILRKIPFVNKKHYFPGGLPVVAAEGGQRIC